MEWGLFPYTLACKVKSRPALGPTLDVNREKKKKRENAVVVIRREGPKGDPECQRCRNRVRQSQGNGRWVIRAGGGWDAIETNESRTLNLLVEPEVLLVRRGKWEVGEKMMEPRVKKVTSGKYAKLVRHASHGCITDTG